MERSAPLGEAVSARIRAWIEGGEFAEGARLPAESALAQRFGVSRPIIREALSRLRSEGAIVSRRGSGSYVSARAPGEAPPPPFGAFNSLAQVRLCYQFRAAIEGDAAFHAAANRTPEQLQHMRQALDKIEAAILGRTVGISPDYEFHAAIASASGNEFFDAVGMSLRR